MPALETQKPLPPGDRPDATGIRVSHSHHYHASLLRTLYEAEGIDAAALLRRAARAAARTLPLAAADWTAREDAAGHVERMGLGRVDLSAVDSGGVGVSRLADSHFARAWLRRFPRASHPVCEVTGALLASLLGRAVGRALIAREIECVGTGGNECRFELNAANGAAPESGSRSRDDDVVGRAWRDRGGELGWLLGAGGPAGIDGLGRPYAHLPAGFYGELAEAFQVEVPTTRGAKYSNLPGILLQEAAHRNGYYLFGEILSSPTWNERIRTRGVEGADQLEPLLEVMGALGWGSWEVMSFVPSERLIVRVADSYEAAAHESLFGRAGSPRCAVARGAAAAIMNLLFRADEAGRSVPTEAGYNQLFRSPSSFRAVETRCRAMGDTCCEIVANPLSL